MDIFYFYSFHAIYYMLLFETVLIFYHISSRDFIFVFLVRHYLTTLIPINKCHKINLVARIFIIKTARNIARHFVRLPFLCCQTEPTKRSKTHYFLMKFNIICLDYIFVTLFQSRRQSYTVTHCIRRA